MTTPVNAPTKIKKEKKPRAKDPAKIDQDLVDLKKLLGKSLHDGSSEAGKLMRELRKMKEAKK